ncbi:phage tail protein [Pseudomonas segetis]
MSSGNIVGGVVGAAVGFVASGFNPVGAAYGFAIGFAAGGLLDPPKGPTVEGPRLSDLSLQTSTYGRFLPRFYGTLPVTGNIIWLEGNKLKETVKKKKQGGKGGGGGTTTKTYTYSATFAIALGEGQLAGIKRIWCRDKLIYNSASDDLETIIASNQNASGWRFYPGSDDQLPDPRIEAEKGVGTTPAYRGTAYIVFDDFQLEDYGNTLEGAQFKFEVVGARSLEVLKEYRDLSYLGTPCYSDENIFQTAEPLTGYIVGGIGGKFHAFVTFRDYNLSGVLIKEETLTATIAVSGTTSLTFYKSCYIYGVKSVMFAQRTPSAISFTVDGPQYALTLNGSQTPGSYSLAGGFYWFAGLSHLYRMNPATKEFIEYTIPSAVEQSLCVVEDDKTGRIYRRYRQAGEGNNYIQEIDSEMNVLWTTNFGGDNDAGIPGKLLFTVSSGRAVIQHFSEMRVYDVSGTSAIDIGSIPNASSISNVFSFASGFAFAVDGTVRRIDDTPSLELVPLADIIQQEAELSSLIEASDINVSLITDGVRGYQVSGGSIRSALEPLQGVWPFDVIQSGYQLKCVPRGQASVATIPWEHLGANDGDEPGDLLKQSREMDTQLPASTHIKYWDVNREYAQGEQYADRPGTSAVNRVDLEVAIVMNAQEAARAVDVLQALRWLERIDFEASLPPIYLALEPADVITILYKNATYQLRIKEKNDTPSGIGQCKLVPNAPSIYTSTANGAEGVSPPDTAPLPGASLVVLMDIPLVDELSQNAVGFASAMTGYSPGWPGGVLVRSADGGQTWDELQGYTGKGGIGFAMATLPASDGYLIDQRSMAVSFISGEVYSITLEQLLTGYNYAAYGVNGRWEIVRFQNATLNADGTYMLSRFVRGDKGTEWATGLHQVGDYFILLDDPDNAFIGSSVQTIGLARDYRAVTSGASIDSSSDVPFTYNGVNLEPLSPVDAKAARDGSGNLSATFVRRSRLGSTWWGNGVEAPIGETTQAYEIDVMSGSTVKRTITASTPAFSYSAANQTTDFGSVQASITFRIYQLSETVGRGFVREVTL